MESGNCFEFDINEDRWVNIKKAMDQKEGEYLRKLFLLFNEFFIYLIFNKLFVLDWCLLSIYNVRILSNVLCFCVEFYCVYVLNEDYDDIEIFGLFVKFQ